jgi:hypothetical protein
MSLKGSSATLRGVLVLAVAMLAAGALAISPAVSAVDGLSSKEKKQGDKRWINVGEKASDADRLDGQDSSAFLASSAKATDADKLDGQDSAAFYGGSNVLWALVESDGSLIRGKGVLASFLFTPGVSDGAYEIVFTRNVDNCAYSATLFNSTAGRGNQAPEGEVGIAPLSTSPTNGLAIQTHNSAGTGVDHDYSLLVLC